MKNYRNISLGLFCFLVLGCGSRNEQSTQQYKPTVRTVKAISQDVVVERDFVGQISGKQDIPITARVAGFLNGIHFEEGSRVNKGQLLYTIDQQPFKASVAAAESQLAEAKTLLVLAENELRRIEPLAKKNAVSQRDLDAALAERDARQASVKAAESRLELERINLSYTEVRSPVNGIIGKTNAKIGEYVGAAPNAVQLNTVSNVESVLVDFFITERAYLTAARALLDDGKEDLTQIEGRGLAPKLILADGSIYDEFGSFSFVNRQVDAATGSILIQTEFPNPQGLLRPGQFSRIRVAIDERAGALVVPKRCLIELQGLFYVYVVNTEGVIEQRAIKRGPDYKDYMVVEEGVQQGESIVIEGTQFVRNGVPVQEESVSFESQFPEEGE